MGHPSRPADAGGYRPQFALEYWWGVPPGRVSTVSTLFIEGHVKLRSPPFNKKPRIAPGPPSIPKGRIYLGHPCAPKKPRIKFSVVVSSPLKAIARLRAASAYGAPTASPGHTYAFDGEASSTRNTTANPTNTDPAQSGPTHNHVTAVV